MVWETCPERMVKEGPSGVMVFKLRSQGGVRQMKGWEKRVPGRGERLEVGKNLVYSRNQRKVG